MRSIKRVLVIFGMMIFTFLLGKEQVVSAQLNNFVSNNEFVVIENDDIYPFLDDQKSGEDVIKSGNQYVNNSESSITIKFSGRGEISFFYLVSSEDNWDFIKIYANGEEIVKDSGNGTWSKFSWYSEDNEEDIIIVKYQKDGNVYANDDCCYLKELSFDQTLYAPLLDFSIDNVVLNMENIVYYDYGQNEGILKVINVTETYDLRVKLNGTLIEGLNYEYDLKNSFNYELNNVIDISYSLQGYKTRSFSFTYNASLSKVMENVGYINDSKNLYVLDLYNDEFVIKSTNRENNSISELEIFLEGSGVLSFNYLISNRRDFDYFRVVIDDELVLDKSGDYNNYESFSYNFYDNIGHSVVLAFYKSNGEYIIGDECVYLKNIVFEQINYVDISTIKLNDIIVTDGEGYSIESFQDNKVVIDNITLFDKSSCNSRFNCF